MMEHLFSRIAPAGTAATALALASGLAQSAGPAGRTDAPIGIAVFADHYVMAGRSFDDLNVLDTALQATPNGSIRLSHCQPGSERAFKAAAHRFRARSIEMRGAAAKAPECAEALPGLKTVAGSTARKPLGIDDAEVERYWSQIAP